MRKETHKGKRNTEKSCAKFLRSLFLIFSFCSFLIFSFSCSSSGDSFRLTGKFKNFNNGELYVYGLQGKGKIDTIRLAKGKFSYELPLEDTLMLSVVFPNFSEIPVLAVPGTDVKMEGDASHLREVKVTGSDENELLTGFRLQVAEQTPPEAEKTAADFIKENPESPVCMYVLNKYFLMSDKADYKKIYNLLSAMIKAQPGNKKIVQIQKQMAGLKDTQKGLKLPKFSATATSGALVTNADLQGELNIVNVWSSWSYESQGIQRQLRRLKKEYGSRLQLLSICLDGNLEDCKKQMERDSIKWYTVCDGKMWQTPIVDRLGICRIPDNIITDRNGKILERGLAGAELESYIKKKMSER